MNEIESMQALFNAKFDALHNEIEAQRLLKQHDLASIQARFQDSRAALDAVLATAQENYRRTDAATEKRFDAVNEFRAQLRDQQATFIPRQELTALLSSLQRDVAQNKDAIGLCIGRSDVMSLLDRADLTLKNMEQAGTNLSGNMWAFGAVITVLNIAVTWWLGVNALHLHG